MRSILLVSHIQPLTEFGMGIEWIRRSSPSLYRWSCQRHVLQRRLQEDKPMRAFMIMLCIMLLAGCAGKPPAKVTPPVQSTKPAADTAATAEKSGQATREEKPGDVLGIRTPAEVMYTEKIFRELTPGYYSYFKASKTGKPFIIFKHEDGRAGFVFETPHGLMYNTADVRMQSKDFIIFSKFVSQPISKRIKHIYDAAKSNAKETASRELLIGNTKAAQTNKQGSTQPAITPPTPEAAPTTSENSPPQPDAAPGTAR